MENRDSARLLRPMRALLLLSALMMNQVSAQSVSNVKVGGELVLELDPKPDKVERVVWKHGADLLAEFTLGQFEYYGTFKGHTSLETSGRLTVSKIQKEEGGEYLVEVNNVIQDRRYIVRVYEVLPKPSIRVTPLSCGPTSPNCTLVCELSPDQTEDPKYKDVQYEWVLEGVTESKPSGKELKINHDTKATNFTCWAQNPVSRQASESRSNPLTDPVPQSSSNIGLVVGLILCLVVGVFVFIGVWKREAIKKFFGFGEYNPTSLNDPEHPAGSEMRESPNGTGTEKPVEPAKPAGTRGTEVSAENIAP